MFSIIRALKSKTAEEVVKNILGVYFIFEATVILQSENEHELQK